jgi:hypothetical protein
LGARITYIEDAAEEEAKTMAWHVRHVLSRRLARRAIVAGSVVLAGGLLAPASGLAVASRAALSGVRVLGWGFASPASIASDGTHVWVANFDANSVTELSATTGRLVQVISGASYQFNGPNSVVSDGTHVWVVNISGNGSVTELSAKTGGLVKVISGSPYNFEDATSVASDGTHVWVANSGSVTELSAKTGRLIKVIGASATRSRILMRSPRTALMSGWRITGR